MEVKETGKMLLETLCKQEKDTSLEVQAASVPQ
jgi:hypothetical protein